MRVKVDRKLCNGDEICTELCPEVFSLDNEGIAVVQVDKVPKELEDDVTEAIESCPEQSISVVDEDEES